MGEIWQCCVSSTVAHIIQKLRFELSPKGGKEFARQKSRKGHTRQRDQHGNCEYKVISQGNNYGSYYGLYLDVTPKASCTCSGKVIGLGEFIANLLIGGGV